MSEAYLVILNRWRFTGWKATAIFFAIICAFIALPGVVAGVVLKMIGVV